MKKISWNAIEIEITRRCQLKCAHCACGEAQDIDISKDTIDALLDNTAMFGEVLLTGGEPTLNIEGMSYFLEQIKKRRIPLMYLNVITNGFEMSNDFVEAIKQYHAYMSAQGADYDDGEYFIKIAVSQDRYHVENTECLEWYQEKLKDIAKVSPKTTGNVPFKMGRAKALKEALYANKPSVHKLAIMTQQHTPVCECSSDHFLLYEDQIIVICDVFITAKGELLNIGFQEYDGYSDEDVICKLGEGVDIYEKLIDFNKGVYGACKYLCQESDDKYNNAAKLLLGMQKYSRVTNMSLDESFAELMKAVAGGYWNEQ